MSKPTVVFLRTGSISFVAGSLIWLLVFLQHDQTGRQRPVLASGNSGSEHADILKELGADAASPMEKSKETIGDFSRIDPHESDMPSELGMDGAPPPFGPGIGSESAEIIAPWLDRIGEKQAVALPVGAHVDPSQERIVAASVDVRDDSGQATPPRVETRVAAAAQALSSSEKIGNTVRGEFHGAGAAPRPTPSAFIAGHPDGPGPKTYKPAGLTPSALSPPPPMPAPHPHRLTAVKQPVDDEPRSIQAAIPPRPPKPRLTMDSALSFFTGLWRSAKPAEPSPLYRFDCRDDAGVAPSGPCSRVGTRLIRR